MRVDAVAAGKRTFALGELLLPLRQPLGAGGQLGMCLHELQLRGLELGQPALDPGLLARRGPVRSARPRGGQLLLALGERGGALVELLVRDRGLRLRDLTLALGQYLLRLRERGLAADELRGARVERLSLVRDGRVLAGAPSGSRKRVRRSPSGASFAACPSASSQLALAHADELDPLGQHLLQPLDLGGALGALPPERLALLFDRSGLAAAPERLIAANDRRGERRSPSPGAEVLRPLRRPLEPLLGPGPLHDLLPLAEPDAVPVPHGVRPRARPASTRCLQLLDRLGVPAVGEHVPELVPALGEAVDLVVDGGDRSGHAC